MRIYEPLAEQFGYSFDDLRRSFLIYAAQSGKLQSIIDRVSQNIAAEKEIYQPIARIEKLSLNMHPGADSIYILARTVNTHNTEVRLSEQGVYDVSATYRFYQNDSTKNPKMSVWLESRAHKDSIIDRQETLLIKDTAFNDCLIRVTFNNPEFNILKIYWLDCDKQTDTVKLKNPPKRPGSTKKPAPKIKPDTATRQHYLIKAMSVKYNFEESDTTRPKEFVGPPPPSSKN
jgi:hypothetical protein